jgi:hypothetical protein
MKSSLPYVSFFEKCLNSRGLSRVKIGLALSVLSMAVINL